MAPPILSFEKLGLVQGEGWLFRGLDIHVGPRVSSAYLVDALRGDVRAAERRLDAAVAAARLNLGDGFDAIEAFLAADAARGAFCFGDAPTLADVYLVPQVESARRFKVDLSRWPRIMAVDEACAKIEAFRRAVPAAQPDAPAGHS